MSDTTETPRPNLIRQYRVMTRTPHDDDWTMLSPFVHGPLYNIPEVRAAIEFCKENVSADMIGLRCGERFYTVQVAFAEEIKEDHFAFD